MQLLVRLALIQEAADSKGTDTADGDGAAGTAAASAGSPSAPVADLQRSGGSIQHSENAGGPTAPAPAAAVVEPPATALGEGQVSGFGGAVAAADATAAPASQSNIPAAMDGAANSSLPRALLLSGKQQPAPQVAQQQQCPSPAGERQAGVVSDGASIPADSATAGPVAAAPGVPVSPPMLQMTRDSSMGRSSTADDSTAADAAVDEQDINAAVTAAPCGAVASGGAGLTAVAEAVTAAGTIAVAAATTVGAAVAGGAAADSAAATSPNAGEAGSSMVAALPAGDVMAAAAAGAAAAVAAAPQAAPAAGSEGEAGGAAAPAAAPEAVLFPKRKRLVLVNDAVKLQAIRLLAVLGEVWTAGHIAQGATESTGQRYMWQRWLASKGGASSHVNALTT